MQKPTDDFTRAPHLDPVRRYQAASHLGTAGFCSRRLRRIVILVGILVSGTAQAESLTGAALVATLRHGGCVILMRHASSPPTPPTVASAEPTNTKLERQLDETGRSSAQAMGEAIKTLTIPIGEVWSSPTYRAQETVRLADLPDPAVAAELGDGERSMQAIAKGQTIWLQAKVAERPRAGTEYDYCDAKSQYCGSLWSERVRPCGRRGPCSPTDGHGRLSGLNANVVMTGLDRYLHRWSCDLGQHRCAQLGAGWPMAGRGPAMTGAVSSLGCPHPR